MHSWPHLPPGGCVPNLRYDTVLCNAVYCNYVITHVCNVRPGRGVRRHACAVVHVSTCWEVLVSGMQEGLAQLTLTEHLGFQYGSWPAAQQSPCQQCGLIQSPLLRLQQCWTVGDPRLCQAMHSRLLCGAQCCCFGMCMHMYLSLHMRLLSGWNHPTYSSLLLHVSLQDDL